MKKRIHIFGASGSGTTSIAKDVSERLCYKHFDTDNYFWYPTENPFTKERLAEERLKLLQTDLKSHENWILSGSLNGWGNPLVPLFELIVFVYVPKEERLERIRKREFERYGKDILPGGKRHEAEKGFIEWAGEYDSGTFAGRNLRKHEEWIKGLDNDVLRIINDSFEDSVNAVIAAIEN